MIDHETPVGTTDDGASRRISVAVIGGGQAGLSASYHLTKRGVDHLVFERKTACHVWSDQRWDSFCLVTPNWQCNLPGHPYGGDDPDGFMVKSEILDYLDGFRRSFDAPLLEGVEVTRVARATNGRFSIFTSKGYYVADQVIVASGGYSIPIIPRGADRLPAHIVQLHSEQYRNPQSLPAGEVLVVGSGQSGAQIAEDLHLAGRKVHLAVGDSPRCARFYRGKDVVTWLAEMNYYELPVDQHPLREGVRDNSNHYVTGRDGGRDIDLRKFAREGMALYGLMDDIDGSTIRFRQTLRAALDAADRTYNGINAAIDKHIADNGIAAPPPSVYRPVWEPEEEPTELDLFSRGVSAIIWCIGFRPDFRWLDAPVFNDNGHPQHQRGITRQPGLYFLGLPWLHTWGSGRFSSVGRDAEFVVDHIAAAREAQPVVDAA
ncbi:MAG: MSMEG_0569 family flavin-dependent oxidoreductase [Beijerinckiaceae bacterium]|nr:MSMEG_0569 family flavin-dependent oxidoreductase [Beijerinckiaceae bacterium]